MAIVASIGPHMAQDKKVDGSVDCADLHQAITYEISITTYQKN